MLVRTRHEGHAAHVTQAGRLAGAEGDVRLGAPLEEVEQGLEGILEIFHAGAWGSVCEVDRIFSTGEGPQARPTCPG